MSLFREIHRADELGSGMRKLMRYCKAYGGVLPELIEGDVFRIILKVPEFASKELENSTSADKPSDQATPEVTPEVVSEVAHLLVVTNGEMDRFSLQTALGLKSEKNFRQLYLRPALEAGLIEMTIPDKPTSSKQRYRLTRKGRKLAGRITGKG